VKVGCSGKSNIGMPPYLGVNRNVNVGWRHLNSSFGCISIHKLFIEEVIPQTKSVPPALQHSLELGIHFNNLSPMPTAGRLALINVL